MVNILIFEMSFHIFKQSKKLFVLPFKQPLINRYSEIFVSIKPVTAYFFRRVYFTSLHNSYTFNTVGN